MRQQNRPAPLLLEARTSAALRAGEPLGWGYTLPPPIAPSRTSGLAREFDFPRLAGLYEKNCMRDLGLEVQMQLPDGSKVDIGEAADGTLHGVTPAGMHTEASLRILHGVPAAAFDPLALTYDGLWSAIPVRASGASESAILRAMDQLLQAIYCRKWDLWCNQQAHTVARARMAAVSWPNPPWSISKHGKVAQAVKFPLIRALKRGLSLAAIGGVADAVIAAVQSGAGDVKAAVAVAAQPAIDAAVAIAANHRPSADDFMDPNPVLPSPLPPRVSPSPPSTWAWLWPR